MSPSQDVQIFAFSSLFKSDNVFNTSSSIQPHFLFTCLPNSDLSVHTLIFSLSASLHFPSSLLLSHFPTSLISLFPSSFQLSDVSSSDLELSSGENLSPDQVLELFMSLFGPQGQQVLPLAIRGYQGSSGSGSKNIRSHQVTSTDSTDSGAVISDRVELASNPSSPTPIAFDPNEEKENHSTVINSLRLPIDIFKVKGEKEEDKMEVSSFNEEDQIRSTTPRDIWSSVSSNAIAVEISSPADGHVRPPRHTHLHPIGHTQTQLQAHDEQSSGQILDQNQEQEQRQSKRSVDGQNHSLNQNKSQNISQNQNKSQREIKEHTHIREVVECSTLARSTLNGGVGNNGTAASKLSEALTKLRQVRQ